MKNIAQKIQTLRDKLKTKREQKRFSKAIFRAKTLYQANLQRVEDSHQHFMDELYWELTGEQIFKTIYKVCPDEKTVIKEVKRIVKRLDYLLKREDKMREMLGARVDENLIERVHDLVKVEDQNDDLKKEVLEVKSEQEKTVATTKQVVKALKAKTEEVIDELNREHLEVQEEKHQIQAKIINEERTIT